MRARVVFLGALFLVATLVNGAALPYKPKHVVVIMFENRAFDHLLGHLKALNPDIRGLTGKESNPIDPLNPNSARVSVSLDAEPVLGANPAHQIDSTNIQLWGSQLEIIPASMTGFIAASNTTLTMKCYNQSTVPVISTLAMKFALFDEFYASVPGPTGPNRMYLHSGTSHGAGINIPDNEAVGYPQRSFFMDLFESKISWKVYFEDFPVVLDLRDIRLFPERFHFMSQFLKEARDGSLPVYSFLEPRWLNYHSTHASTQHPDNSVYYGELLLKEVYEALRAGPHWNDTVLIVTYDEHGGCYDHKPPPVQSVPNPDGINSTQKGSEFSFDRLGLRVPFVVVSPRVPQGALWHEAGQNSYEHSSVMKTVRRWLGMKVQRPLTKREDWAASFEDVLSLAEPRTDCPSTLPIPPSMQRLWDALQAMRKVPLATWRERFHVAPEAQTPLNDIQLDVVSLASRFLGERGVSLAELESWTQQQGAEFVYQQIAKFLDRAR